MVCLTHCVQHDSTLTHSPLSANNYALKSKRKTLNAVDVFSALDDMEFEQFAPELRNFLEGRMQMFLILLLCPSYDYVCNQFSFILSVFVFHSYSV